MLRQTVLAATVVCLCAVVAMGSPALAQEERGVEDGERIQDTIDDADPGDTIQIESGTYQEHLTVTVPNVTLVGVGDSPVIEGIVAKTPVVNITAPGVTIDSLTVSGGDGIGIIDEENRSVRGTGDGIRAFGADGLTIVDSRVVDNDGWGVNIRNSPGSAVVNSTLTNNVWDGAIFIHSNRSVARDNNASGNGIEEQFRTRHGIRFTNTSHGYIEHNRVVGNAYGGVLFTERVRNNTVRDNVLRSNGDRGLGTFGAFRANRVVNNTIADNDDFGVLTYTPGGNNTFRDNLVSGNGGTGIAVDDTDGNRIRNNTVVDQYIGIRTGASTGTTITNNTVRSGSFSGISVSQSEAVFVQANTVSDSEVGILLTGDATGHVVADNVVTTNSHGVAVQAPVSGGTVVSYNDIVDNEGYGAVVFEGSYHPENSSFSTVPAATAGVSDLNATHNYWGTTTGPTATAPDGNASNTVSPNVIVQSVTAESTDAPASLTRHSRSNGSEDSGDDESDEGSDGAGDDESDEGSDGAGDDESDEGSDDTGDDESGEGSDDTGDNDSDDDGTDNGTRNEAVEDDGADRAESSDEDGPGFGALVGLAGLIAAVVIVRQHHRICGSVT